MPAHAHDDPDPTPHDAAEHDEEDFARRIAATFSRAMPQASVHVWRGSEQRDVFVGGRLVER